MLRVFSLAARRHEASVRAFPLALNAILTHEKFVMCLVWTWPKYVTDHSESVFVVDIVFLTCCSMTSKNPNPNIGHIA